MISEDDPLLEDDDGDGLESALIRLAGGRGECGKCGKHFSRVADCRRHLLRSHAVGNHFCTVCMQRFNNAYALQRHVKTANHHQMQFGAGGRERQQQPPIL